jgi:hypothetical protein
MLVMISPPENRQYNRGRNRCTGGIWGGIWAYKVHEIYSLSNMVKITTCGYVMIEIKGPVSALMRTCCTRAVQQACKNHFCYVQVFLCFWTHHGGRISLSQGSGMIRHDAAYA